MLGRLLPLVALGAGQGMTESSLGPTSEDPYALRGVNPLNLELIKLVSSKERAPVAAVQKLLDDGASPSSHGDYNYTALMWAIVRRAPDHVHTLLEAGADTEFTNAWGRNAIFLAAWEGQTEVMEMLIKHGADVHGASQHDAYTALHKAAGEGHTEVVRTRACTPPCARATCRSPRLVRARRCGCYWMWARMPVRGRCATRTTQRARSRRRSTSPKTPP